MRKLSEQPSPGVLWGGVQVTIMAQKKVKIDHFFIFLPNIFSVKLR